MHDFGFRKVSPAKQLLIQQVGFVNLKHFFQHRSGAKHWYKNLKILATKKNWLNKYVDKYNFDYFSKLILRTATIPFLSWNIKWLKPVEFSYSSHEIFVVKRKKNSWTKQILQEKKNLAGLNFPVISGNSFKTGHLTGMLLMALHWQAFSHIMSSRGYCN